MLLERDPAPEHSIGKALYRMGTVLLMDPLELHLINMGRTSPIPSGGVEAQDILSPALFASRMGARACVKGNH